jgi:hypothetical protein
VQSLAARRAATPPPDQFGAQTGRAFSLATLPSQGNLRARPSQIRYQEKAIISPKSEIFYDFRTGGVVIILLPMLDTPLALSKRGHQSCLGIGTEFKNLRGNFSDQSWLRRQVRKQVVFSEHRS